MQADKHSRPAQGGDSPTTQFMVGAARRSVSPNSSEIAAGDIYLGGFGTYKSRGPALGVHDPIQARALAIGTSERPQELLVLVIVDTIGMGDKVTRAIQQSAGRVANVSPDAVLVGSTHTHSGPDLQGLWGGVSPGYLTRLIAETAATVRDAVSALRPADVRVGSALVPAEHRNRRGWGFADDRFTVLQAHADGETVATLVNYSSHPVLIGVHNRLLASDWVGPFCHEVEALHGGVALCFMGALGDVSPQRPDVASDDPFLRATTYGTQLAKRVPEAMARAWPLDPAIRITPSTAALDIENETFLHYDQAGWTREYATLGTPERPDQVTVPITAVTMGESAAALRLLTVPGEAVTRLGQRLCAALGGKEQMLLGLTGCSVGYLIPRDEWLVGRHNNYEESVSMGPQAGETLLAAVLSMHEALSA